MAFAAAGVIDVVPVGAAAHVTVTDNGRAGADPVGIGIDGLRRRVEAPDASSSLPARAAGRASCTRTCAS
ncbi:hypothetical protein [Micromonospora sp. NPDC050200]|uniref:hypothetical protein n=1 Tax=Micromonospora sp. NPDC050200 TaxID=3155664 RepID=UPI0033E924B7